MSVRGFLFGLAWSELAALAVLLVYRVLSGVEFTDGAVVLYVLLGWASLVIFAAPRELRELSSPKHKT